MRPEIEFYPKIVEALKKSEAGTSLENTYRWSEFRRNETNKEWRSTLGATAQDMTHGQLFYGMGRVFLDYENGRFSDKKQQTFLYGLLSHDWGEAIIDGQGVGDVSAQIKTDVTEKSESIIARKVIDSLDLPVTTRNQILSGYEQVVEGSDKELHQAFKALEKTEYVTTAVKVFLSERRIEMEKPLVGRVIVKDLAKVLDVYVTDYPLSIGKYFHNLEPVIGRMMDYTFDWLEQTPTWKGKTANHADLVVEFRKKWKAFVGK